MLNIQIELNIVKPKILVFVFILHLIEYFCFTEILLDEKSASNVEIAEDALGDEVYYSYSKTGRKLLDENDLDEERM